MSPNQVRKYFDLIANGKAYELKFTPNIPIEHVKGMYATMKCNDDTYPPVFTVSLDHLSKNSNIEIKELILHEVGHIHHSPILSRTEGEYQAQVWALAKARDIGDYSLVSAAIERFKDWGLRKNMPEYLNAYKKAVKNKII